MSTCPSGSGCCHRSIHERKQRVATLHRCPSTSAPLTRATMPPKHPRPSARLSRCSYNSRARAEADRRQCQRFSRAGRRQFPKPQSSGTGKLSDPLPPPRLHRCRTPPKQPQPGAVPPARGRAVRPERHRTRCRTAGAARTRQSARSSPGAGIPLLAPGQPHTHSSGPHAQRPPNRPYGTPPGRSRGHSTRTHQRTSSQRRSPAALPEAMPPSGGPAALGIHAAG